MKKLKLISAIATAVVLATLESCTLAQPKMASVYSYPNSPGYLAVLDAARRHEVNPALALAIAKRESHGRCDQTSSAGARGPMGVMVNTAKRHGFKGSSSRLLDCRTGAQYGMLELKRLVTKYNGDMRLIAIAFNCGEGCLRRRKLPKETRAYVRYLTARQFVKY